MPSRTSASCKRKGGKAVVNLRRAKSAYASDALWRSSPWNLAPPRAGDHIVHFVAIKNLGEHVVVGHNKRAMPRKTVRESERGFRRVKVPIATIDG